MFKRISKNERIELATKLLNEQMNDTLQTWSDNPEDLYVYAWGWRGDKEVGSNHGKSFYYADAVIRILVALELNWHLSLSVNEDGEPTPTICFF